MDDKRKYPRVSCKIKAKFNYYEGNPETIDISTMKPKKGKGIILDISQGGLFIVSGELVNIHAPTEISFETKHEKYTLPGKVVRTGKVKNNPSEVAQRFAEKKVKGKYYIAIEFDTPLTNVPGEICDKQ